MSGSQYNKIITAINTVTEDYEFIPNDNCIVIDTSNNRIGINTTDPQHNIDVSGPDGSIKSNKVICNLILAENTNSDIGSSTNSFNNIFSRNLTMINGSQNRSISIDPTGVITLNGDVYITGSIEQPSTQSGVQTVNSGNFGDATMTRSILYANKAINSTPIGFQYISGENISRLVSDICPNYMDDARFLKVYAHRDVCFNQMVNISGDLFVEYGQSTLSGGLIVNTNAEFNCDTSFNYNVEVSNHLLVKDASFSNNVEISNNLIVIGDTSLNNVDISQNLLVLGDASVTNVDISQNLLVLGDASFTNVDISQNLLVLGDASFTNVEISQNLLVLGNVDASNGLKAREDIDICNYNYEYNINVDNLNSFYIGTITTNNESNIIVDIYTAGVTCTGSSIYYINRETIGGTHYTTSGYRGLITGYFKFFYIQGSNGDDIYITPYSMSGTHNFKIRITAMKSNSLLNDINVTSILNTYSSLTEFHYLSIQSPGLFFTGCNITVSGDINTIGALDMNGNNINNVSIPTIGNSNGSTSIFGEVYIESGENFFGQTINCGSTNTWSGQINFINLTDRGYNTRNRIVGSAPNPYSLEFYVGGASVMKLSRTWGSTPTVAFYGPVTSTGSITPGSDDRIKHNEIDISNALNIINKLIPQVYDKTMELKDANYNGPLEEGTYVKEAGLIAQEVYEIEELKPFVKIGNDQEIWGLNYNSIFTYGLAATKELDEILQGQAVTIQDLSRNLQEKIEEINNLKNENSLIKTTLNRLLTDLSYTYQI